MRNRQRGDAGMRNIAKLQRLMGVLALLLALALALAIVALAALAVLAVLGHHVLEVFGVGLDVVAFIIFVVVVIVFVAVGRTRGARARHAASGRAAGRAAARRRRLGRPRRPLGVGRVFGNGLLVLGLAADVLRLARRVLVGKVVVAGEVILDALGENSLVVGNLCVQLLGFLVLKLVQAPDLVDVVRCM